MRKLSNSTAGTNLYCESVENCSLPPPHRKVLWVLNSLFVCWLLNVPATRECICPDNFTCCHTEMEVADQTFYLTQSQYTDTGPTSPSADPITPGAWQGSHWSANFKSLLWLDPEKILVQAGFKPGIFRSRGGCLNTRPARPCSEQSSHTPTYIQRIPAPEGDSQSSGDRKEVTFKRIRGIYLPKRKHSSRGTSSHVLNSTVQVFQRYGPEQQRKQWDD